MMTDREALDQVERLIADCKNHIASQRKVIANALERGRAAWNGSARLAARTSSKLRGLLAIEVCFPHENPAALEREGLSGGLRTPLIQLTWAAACSETKRPPGSLAGWPFG
jgi:hypothetical protein